MLKVSVIIPSYNHADYVCETIKSVLAQNTTDFEIELIVVDDFSQDGSVKKISMLEEEYSFIFLKNNENIGLNRSLNYGLTKCTGEYTSIISSDDIMLPDKISKQLDFLKKENLDCVYSKGSFINELGEVLGEQNLDEFCKAVRAGKGYEFAAVDDTCCPLLQSALLKTSLMREVASLRSVFKSDDWVVLLYLLRNTKFGFVDEVFFQYRLHTNNTHAQCWKTLPMRLEVPCVFLSESENGLRQKSISNTLASHSMALFRRRKYLIGARFFFASLCFGFPGKKIYRMLLKSFHHA